MLDHLQHFSVHFIHVLLFIPPAPSFIITWGSPTVSVPRSLTQLHTRLCRGGWIVCSVALSKQIISRRLMKCIIVWYRMPLDIIVASCSTGWVTGMLYWLLEQQQYFHTHTHTHARTHTGASIKACPFNHDCPSFRLEPYIWTYIFMLYFILSYMLGLCLRDIYVYLLAQVGFRLQDLFTKSSFSSSVLAPMYL